MIPIILCSIAGLAIIIEKLWVLRRVKMNMEAFSEDVFAKLRAGKTDAALDLCDEHKEYPLAVIFKAGIEKREKPPFELEKIMERVGNNQVKDLEKYLGGLISIIGIEPLLGFLGTITGLIKAFMAWEKAGSNITVSALASGMYQAMITTAAGLIVAAPYFLIYNYIISKIRYISMDLTDYSMRLVEVLSEAKVSGKK